MFSGRGFKGRRGGCRVPVSCAPYLFLSVAFVLWEEVQLSRVIVVKLLERRGRVVSFPRSRVWYSGCGSEISG